MHNKTIAIVGLGYVGLPLALLADQKGYEVIGIEISKNKVDLINSRRSPIQDEELEAQLKASRIRATSDWSEVRKASIVIICVPTPVDANYLPDLTPIENAVDGLGPYLEQGALVILESTVNPGISEGVVLPHLEIASALKAGRDFYLAHCPERINPGDKNWSVRNIPRVVGGLNEKSLKLAYNFYTSIIEAPIKKMGSLREAEAVKLVENSFRDINIAFVNELARSFSKLGIDVVNVIDGAATKPFGFMAHYPGCGVGGHCIPVDPYYLIEYAKSNGFNHEFLALARQINNDMPRFSVSLVESGLAEAGLALSEARVAVLGLAYKADIDDCRESPSFKIISELEKRGAKVASFDPFALGRSSAQSLADAVTGADAVIIATAHTLFKDFTPEFFKRHGIKLVVDGRNCLNYEMFAGNNSGLIYIGIGRGHTPQINSSIIEHQLERLQV